MKDHDLAKLVGDLAEAQKELDRLTADEEEAHERGKPATATQIAALERRIGRPLPPSYKAFLQLHNGWADFAGGAKLLAVEDHDSPWVRKRIDQIGSYLFSDDAANPFLNGCFPVLLGKDENSYLVLDARKARKDGEMDFVLYDYGEEERRFKDFTAFLKNELKLTQRLIKSQKKGKTTEEEEE
jgi:hypothetical protein